MGVHFERHRLENGLTVIAETNPEAYTGAIGFFVKTGTRDESLELMGVSHFLEHMMFKGTTRRTADDVNREFDEVGANYNAFTGHEMTVYYAQVLPEFIPRVIDLVGDMLRPALRKQDFDMEKNVILEEIGMYEDRPQWRLHDTLVEMHFGGHPLSYRVLGTVDSIKALSVEELCAYFDQRYSPDNIIIAAAGRIEFAKLLEDVNQIASRWQPTGAVRQYNEPQIATREHKIADEKLNRHYFAMICPGPSAQDPRRYAAKILADVIGDSDGSRLYWALIEPGLADEADFSSAPQDQIGSFYAYATCTPERWEKVEKILIETIDGYANSIDAGEIERAKNKIATGATLLGESPLGRMRGLGAQWTYLGQYIPLEVELDHIMQVTVDDIRNLLEQMPLQPRTICRLGPN